MAADTRPMTLGDWMLTILVLAIPVVNIVMYVYWAVSDSGNANRRTFCQASILWAVIGFGIMMLVFFLMPGFSMLM